MFEVQESTEDSKNVNWLYLSKLERAIVGTIENSVAFQREMGLVGPVWISLSMVGVFGVRVADNPSGTGWVDRPNLLFPAVVIDESTASIPDHLSPLLDQMWRAASLERPVPGATEKLEVEASQ